MRWGNVNKDGQTHAGLVAGDTIQLTHAHDVSELLPDLETATMRAGEAGSHGGGEDAQLGEDVLDDASLDWDGGVPVPLEEGVEEG